MVNRPLLHHGIRVATAIALLVAVIISPIRPARSVGGSSHPVHLRHNFAGPTTHTPRHAVTSVTPRPVRVKALPSENEEEELSETTWSACCPFDPPPDPSSKPGQALAAFGPDRVTHPLRC
jgi:hypothetical protein